MKLKLFGKDIFEFCKGGGVIYLNQAQRQLKKLPHLPDFYVEGTSTQFNSGDFLTAYTNVDIDNIKKEAAKKKAKGKEAIELTPKEIFEMKMLNDKSVKIITDKNYIKEQLKSFKDKLDIVASSNHDMANGVKEIGSIIIRLENRKKYPDYKSFFEKYPYTTTEKIEKLIKAHDYLKMGQVEQFIAEMPVDAVTEMKEYTKYTKKICGKKPLFYIIANQKDFKKTQKRRDPILLAQSPFCHNWQMLGAWDEEMMLLGEL